jgi:hypothetical protein
MPGQTIAAKPTAIGEYLDPETVDFVVERATAGLNKLS